MPVEGLGSLKWVFRRKQLLLVSPPGTENVEVLSCESILARTIPAGRQRDRVSVLYFFQKQEAAPVSTRNRHS